MNKSWCAKKRGNCLKTRKTKEKGAHNQWENLGDYKEVENEKEQTMEGGGRINAQHGWV